MADEISLGLSRDQALVLFEWLARTGIAGEPVGFEDQAEQRVLWDLEAALEKILIEPLTANYLAKLEAARGRVRDSATFGINVLTQGEPLELGTVYDPTAPAQDHG